MRKLNFFLRFLSLTLLYLILGIGLLVYGGFAEEAEEAEEAQEAEQPEVSTAQSPVISMDFKDANLKDILKAFSIQSGLNFVASQEIEDRKITLYLDKVSVREAMDKLLKASNLSYDFYEDSKIILVKMKEAEPKITKLFQLRYARVSSSPINGEIKEALGGTSAGGAAAEEGVTAVIKSLLSAEGKVIEDARINALIITDFPDRFPIIEETVKELDMPVPQVMLEVEMLDVSKNVVDSLGFEFGDNPFTIINHGANDSTFFLGTLSNRAATIDTSAAAGSLVLGTHFAYLLDFLRTQTDTKYLARPKILTLNNETAELRIITDEVIGEEITYDDNGLIQDRTAERAETGVSLRITPQINMETGEITMFISPKVIEASTSAWGASYRDPEERGTNSLVKVRDGETIVAGGLIRNESSEINKKLPILGDIPFLGVLFRHKSKTKDRERELLVFITPHIVKDASPVLMKEGTAILPSREQDTQARLLKIESALNNLNATTN